MKNIFKLCKSHWKKKDCFKQICFSLTLFLFQLLQLAKFLHASENEAEIDGNVHQLIAEMALVVSKLLDYKNYFHVIWYKFIYILWKFSFPLKFYIKDVILYKKQWNSKLASTSLSVLIITINRQIWKIEE